jgi:hypothetical protein
MIDRMDILSLGLISIILCIKIWADFGRRLSFVVARLKHALENALAMAQLDFLEACRVGECE